MKRIWIDAIIILVLVGGFIGAWFIFDLGKVTVTKIHIETEYKDKIVYKDTPGDCATFKAAFFDPWSITGKTRDMYLDVTAQNKYIRMDKTFKIGCDVKPLHHEIMVMLIGGASFDKVKKSIELGYGAGVTYSYNFGRVGLGIGPGVVTFPTHYDFLVNAGGFLRF